MKHVLNIAFDFDDDKVKSIAENAIQNNIDEIITNVVLDQFAPMEQNYYNRKKERNFRWLHAKLDDQIVKFLNEHKEEIIDRAAKQLNESLRRTKAWKERALEGMDNVDNN